MNNTDLEQKKECTSIIVVELVVNTDIGTLFAATTFISVCHSETASVNCQ